MDSYKLEQIRLLGSKLESPKDYFAGTPPPTLNLPQNIILFHRHKKTVQKESSKHHRFLLMINCQGKGDVILNGLRFQLKVGQGILIFPFQHHHYANQEEPMSWLKITFELTAFEELENLRNQVFDYTEEALDLVYKITSIYNIETFKQAFFANQIMFILGALLNEINHHVFSKIPKSKSENKQTPLIDKMNQYIMKNIHQNLEIETIAKQFHYSESHIRALYRAEMKLSMGAYIQEIRIHKAQEYLGSTAMPISEIAELCGYSSLYVFSNAFKKYLKISPLQYRKKLK